MILFVASCSEEPSGMQSSATNIPGTYVGRYYGGFETVELRDNGTFRQKFETNGAIVYTNDGKWTFSPPNVIHFTPFVYLIDLSGNSVETGKPSLSADMAAKLQKNPHRIEFGPWPYIVTKKQTR